MRVDGSEDVCSCFNKFNICGRNNCRKSFTSVTHFTRHPWPKVKIPLTCDLTLFPISHRQRAYSKDTSIPEEDTNFGPRKSSHNFCICYLYWRDPSIQGKWTLGLLHSGGLFLSTQRSPWRQLSQLEPSRLHSANGCTYCTCGNSTHNIFII